MLKMKLSVKLISGFMAVSLITLLVGYIGSTRVKSIAEADSQMYTLNTRPLGNMGDIATSFQKMRGFLKDIFLNRYLLSRDTAELTELIKEIDRDTQAALVEFEKSIVTADIKKDFDTLKNALTQYYPVRDKVIGLAVDGRMVEAVQLMTGDGAVVAKQADDAIKKLFQLNIDHAGKAAKQNSATAGSAVLFTWIAAGAGTILALLLGVFLSLSITRPINRVVEGLTEASDQVAAASRQVSSAGQQLAEGASEQAAAIEETSSSLEEMASMTKQNAEHANRADHLMTGTRDVVAKADDSMNRLTDSMAEISRSSEETSHIIKTIDEIAFQTNLLALNAAVEAARAGEAGAGFAVVADEVRNLAMRAADAAKTTAGLIEGTVKRVKEGVDLVAKTSSEFSEVTSSTAKMSELVGEIDAASQEQAQGIEQINKAVGEMDKVVQQNAANAEETASASEEMSAQAMQMKLFVGQLSEIVEGTTGGSGASTDGYAQERKVKKSKKTTVSAAPARAADTGRKTSGKANGGVHKDYGAPLTASGFKPEHVIPFDDPETSSF